MDTSSEKFGILHTMLRKGNYKRETESPLIAAQNDAKRTNYIEAKFDSAQQNHKCRLCGDRMRGLIK